MRNQPERPEIAVRFVRFRPSAVLILLSAALAMAQTPARSTNFDIRTLPLTLGQAAPAAPDAARGAQIVSLQTRLASTVTEAGLPLRYSLNSQGRIKLLSGGSGALTLPSAQAPEAIAAAWLDQHRDLFDLAAPEIVFEDARTHETSAGLRFVELERKIGGLPIFGSNIRLAIDPRGSIVQVQGGADPPVAALTPFQDAGPQAAIAAAYRSLGINIAAPPQSLGAANPVWTAFSNPESAENPSILLRQVAFPLPQGTARAAYRINAVTSRGAFDILVAADSGQLLYRVNLEAHLGQARVWPNTPIDEPRELIGFPDGWLPPGGTVTKGNNADSFLDANGDGKPDNLNRDGFQTGRAFNDSQIFDFPAGDGFGPPSEFRAHAVTQAFYHVNVAHDYFYQLGFREKDGNFQTDNFGKGGNSGDAVSVHVQVEDEQGFASFLTLGDGVPGKMNLGVLPYPDGTYRDAALSGEIILHEYGHGVSSRVVGGPHEIACLSRGPQGDALAEAWSDYFAASFFDAPLLGRYDAEFESQGIRRFALDQTPWKYFDIGNEGIEPHADGEIFAATLWDIRLALGAAAADSLIYRALALTPCQPSFLDARDAILDADQTLNTGANLAALWTVFAARGMGFGSAGGDPDFGPVLTRFDSTTALPANLGGTNFPPKVTSQPANFAIVGDTEYYTITAQDPEGDSWTVEMIESPPNAIFEPNLRRVRWRPSFTDGRFLFAVTDSKGNKTIHGFVWLTFSIITLQNSLSISGPLGSVGVAGFIFDDPSSVLQVTLRDGQGDPDLTLWPPLVGEYQSFNLGPNETLSIPDPPIGVWYVFVDGGDAYSGVRLRARALNPTDLVMGVPKTGLADPETGERFYRLAVPAATPRIRVQLLADNGDADLLAAYDRIPTCQILALAPCDFDESSETPGSREVIEIKNPEAGNWYFNISAFGAYQGLAIKASTASAPVVAAATDGAAFSKTIAPGGISTLFGEGFTAAGVTAAASSLPLPTELAGVAVFVDGVPAPLYYVSEKQINFQNPFAPVFDSATIVVVRDGEVSATFEAKVELDVPRLFTFYQGEQQEPVISHVDGSVVTAQNPATPGEILIAYLTGVGALNNPPPTGAPAGADPLTTTADIPVVIVNGIEVTADFSGWSPGFVSLVQVNFRLPSGLPPGQRATIKLRYGSVSTQQLTLAIQ